MTLAHLFRGLIVSAALVVAVAGPAWAQGKLEVEGGDTFNWGRVAPGPLKTTISVKNVGDAPLKITEVRPSCGCTAAPIDKDLLQPGEVGKISIVMNATGSGPQRKTLSISSDDPSNPSQVINLVADLRPVLTFEPKNYFLVNNGQVGVPFTATVSVINRSDEDVTFDVPALVQANATVKFSMTAPVTLKAGEKLDLVAEVTPLQAGPINGEVSMKTSTKEFPDVLFNVWGNATPAAPPTSSTGPGAK